MSRAARHYWHIGALLGLVLESSCLDDRFKAGDAGPD